MGHDQNESKEATAVYSQFTGIETTVGNLLYSSLPKCVIYFAKYKKRFVQSDHKIRYIRYNRTS